MAVPVLNGKTQFLDAAGVSLALGSVSLYVPGTTTPKQTWQDQGKTILNSTPTITLDAGGYAMIYGSGAYRQIVKDVLGNTIWDQVAWATDVEVDLAQSTGSSLIGFIHSAVGAVATTVQNVLRSLYLSVMWDIRDDGTDQGAKLQAFINAIPANGKASLCAGTFLTAQQLTFPNSNVTLDMAGATIKAAAGAQFEYVLKASSKSNVTVANGTIDANQANRTSGQNTRFCGIGFIDCTDCEGNNLKVKNTLGYGIVSGVGLVVGGASIRCGYDGCLALNCGTALLPSDGFFVSGTEPYVVNSIADTCTDTGFVVESADFGEIDGCTANNCAGGGAITNATATDKRGNRILGLTVNNWNASVTGGVQIGCPSSDPANIGNLYDSQVGVIMTLTNGALGTGPAINVRQQGYGRAKDVRITAQIRGASTQGILVDGDNVAVLPGTNIEVTTSSAIQYQTGSSGSVNGVRTAGGSFGFRANGTAVVDVLNCNMSGAANQGIYAADTSVVAASNNKLSGNTGGETGQDGGATLLVSDIRSGVLKVNGYQVIGPRITGWSPATGTATRAPFATGAVTLPVLAEHVKALIDDLMTHGLITA